MQQLQRVGPAGKAIGVDLLKNPDAVANDPVVSFQDDTAQRPKPSAHNVITSKSRPTGADSSAGRVSGYGLIPNIINGGIEYGKGSNQNMENIIRFYKIYCQIIGVNFNGAKQIPFWTYTSYIVKYCFNMI